MRSLLLFVGMWKWGHKLGGFGPVLNLLAGLALLLLPLLVLGAYTAACACCALLRLRSVLVVHDAVVGLGDFLAVHDGGIAGPVLEGRELVGVATLARN